MDYTTRSDFPEQLPAVETLYCWHCHAPGAQQHDGEHIRYSCNGCGRSSDRVLAYNPSMQQHFGPFGYLFHNQCGVFIRRRDGKLLLLKSRSFPYLLTIPAAHQRIGESTERCAARAVEEAIGLRLSRLTEIFEGTTEADSCMFGADVHDWHVYLSCIDAMAQITLGPEYESWGWYLPREVMPETTAPAVLSLLSRPRARQWVDKDWTPAQPTHPSSAG